MTILKSAPLVGLLLLGTVPIRAQAPASSPTPTVDQRVDAIVNRMTLDQKIDLLGGVDDFYIRGYPQLGWPRLRMSDGPMGARNFGPSTAYPAGIGLAATWDPAMARRIGASIGRDARAKGDNFLLGPGVNIYRAPMDGRNFEFFGEDPFLGAQITVGYIEGVQSQGVVATVKHFVANNSEFDRHNVNSRIDERTLHEIYLPMFEAAVKQAHVGAIMDSYNLVNGEHMTQNGRLNTDVVKRDWGFRGIIMSDWGATYDGIAAANGGLDLEMPSGRFMNRATLLPAIKAGKVSVATIDDKVRRIVRTAVEFGFLDRPQQKLGVPRYNEKDRKVALQGAEESIVLLKNEGGLLPLDKSKIKTLAVLGPDAYPAEPVGGGSAQVRPFNSVSFLEGISQHVRGRVKVLYNRGLVPEADILAQTRFSVDSTGKEPGLRAEYFANSDFSGASRRQTDPRIDFHWEGAGLEVSAVPARSVRWTGYYTPDKTGRVYWLINCSGRDASRLTIDGKQVYAFAPRESQVPEWIALPMEAGRPYAVTFEVVTGPSWGGQTIGLGAIAAADIVDPDAVKMAAASNAAVVCIGYDPGSEHEGADRSFQLPVGQDDLVEAIRAANPKTIVVLTAGGSADVSRWIARVPAFFQAWYPGQEGGRAFARLLFGDADPSGRLPISFERRWADNPVHDSYYENAPDNTVDYKEGIFMGYRGYQHNDVAPLFPFGFGLSYTTFAFKDLRLEPAAPKLGQTVTVSFDVTNTGARTGAEVAQLYLGNPTAPVPMPPEELKAFERIVLKPGETRRVTLKVDPRAMSFWDVTTHGWRQDPGKYLVYVGHSSADTDLRAEYEVKP